MNRIRIELLPPAGYVIAELKSKLLFEPYAVENGKLRFRGSECLETEPMIECHFFSRDREYRLIAREARGDLIERVLSAEEERAMDPDLLYEQEMLVKEEYARRGDLPEKLVVPPPSASILLESACFVKCVPIFGLVSFLGSLTFVSLSIQAYERSSSQSAGTRRRCLKIA